MAYARTAVSRFKLPVTTMLNHDAPITPEGVRACPVAGVQWNGPAHDPESDRLYVNAIDRCALYKLGPSRSGARWSPIPDSPTVWEPPIR